MPARRVRINPWYLRYAEQEMLIDEDDNGLLCQVPSETDGDLFHTVRVDQSMLVPVAQSCGCKQYEMQHDCKHCHIVNSFYERIYKSNVEKIQAKREAKLMDMPLNGAREFSLTA
jgi:hypothetical protein